VTRAAQLSGGKIGHQLYNKFGAGKLNGVNFQSAPADEAQGAGYGFCRLVAASSLAPRSHRDVDCECGVGAGSRPLATSRRS
jgi:hypothetical protein